MLNAISDDWISEFFSFCFFPLIFYYVVKIIENQKKLDYLKLSVFSFFWIINGHIGVITVYIIFLLLFFLLSLKSFNHLKKIFNKFFFISIFLVIILLFEHLFFLIREGSIFDSEKLFKYLTAKDLFLRSYFHFHSRGGH